MISDDETWNSDDEILAKSQTLSLDIKNFKFSGFISTLSACAVGSIMAKNFP